MAECIDGTVAQWDTIRASGHETLVNEAGFNILPFLSHARGYLRPPQAAGVIGVQPRDMQVALCEPADNGV